MNADNMPSEMTSYIVRQTEPVNATKEQKKRKNIGKYISCVAAVVIVLALVCGRYGMEKKAAAYEKEEISVQALMEEKVAPVVADDEAETEEYVAGQTAEPIPKEESVQDTVTALVIPNGADLISHIAKQEVTAGHEENISGLLWNYELIADIQNRIMEAQEEEELLRQEEYRELLVTLGMNEDYVSQDPELPGYLTKTYNPLMDIELTEQELSELLRLVEAEAPAEDIYGKILVANVVLNRVNNEKMADTVTGVIYEKIGGSAQFSPTAISWYWNSIEVTDSTREAVARCLSGEDYSDGALYFYAWERDPNKHKNLEWMRELECLFTHGGHRFFR